MIGKALMLTSSWCACLAQVRSNMKYLLLVRSNSMNA